MIFTDKNINLLILKLFVYALHANTCLHKNYDTVLIILTCLINLNVFKCLYPCLINTIMD
jgi:hypothetical protein